MEQKAFASWKIILLFFVIIGFVFGAYLGLAAILRKFDKRQSASSSSSNTNSQSTKSVSGNFDKNLVGTWESECLVPDPESKWAQKDQIIIKSDGTATHTGWNWFMNNCTTLQPENTVMTGYNLSIPSSGKINFTYTAYNNPQMSADLQKTAKIEIGAISYDIYKVSGNTLEFGQGFRGDNLPYGTKFGGSDTERIDSLNSYIVYKKK